MAMKSLIMLIAQLSLVLIVVSVGCQAHEREVFRTMRNSSLIIRSVIVVNLVVPLTAVLVCLPWPMAQPIKIGIVLMAVSPLAPVLSVRLLKSGVDASFAVGLDVALILLSVVIVPATVALLSWIFQADASISAGAIAKLVTLSVLAPLAAGLLLGTIAPILAVRLARMATIAGFVGIGIVVVAILYAHAADVFALVGSGAVLAIAITASVGIAGGHLVGGPDRLTKLAVALAAALRHPGMALLIAQRNFPDQRVKLAIVLYLLTAVFISLLYQGWIMRRPDPAPGAPAL